MNPRTALRLLIADALHHAGSGHPGAALGMTDMGYTLWTRHLKHAAQDPHWLNRDRFVLSNGHACMLLYALLHLSGYPLSRAALRSARSLHSLTPGHPEYGLTPGIDISTGPLGQGLANAVGFALAERELARRLAPYDDTLIDHMTYAFVGDGCLMEGISHEACALAGVQKLGKLIVLYDANDVSIEGHVAPWFNEQIAERFHSYHWQVIGPIDGHDPIAIDAAIQAAQQDSQHPSLIICRTIIGRGLPRAGTADVHGCAVSATDLAALCHNESVDSTDLDTIPTTVYDAFHRNPQAYEDWQTRYTRFCAAYPDIARFTQTRRAPCAYDPLSEVATWADTPIATRHASGRLLSTLSVHYPELIGATADLGQSTQSLWKNAPIISPDQAGQFLQCGVREFGMSAIMNGIAAYGAAFIPFDSTFLVFSDYARPAIRMAAMMKLWRIFLFSHDSIAVGGDGPTHQPVEQLMSLRLIPHLTVLRPADARETAACWQYMLTIPGTYALILSRQTLPAALTPLAPLSTTGARRIRGSDRTDCWLVASGSEVALACDVQASLADQYPHLGVISLCSLSLWSTASPDRQEAIIGKKTPLILLEAGRTQGWDAFCAPSRPLCRIGVDTFGHSGAGGDVQKAMGLSVEAISARIVAFYAACHAENGAGTTIASAKRLQ